MVAAGLVMYGGFVNSLPEQTLTPQSTAAIQSEPPVETQVAPEEQELIGRVTDFVPPKKGREPERAANCHPSYSGCLEMNAGDYDCAGGTGNGPNYTAQIQVYGYDEFGLDRDGDGWACE